MYNQGNYQQFGQRLAAVPSPPLPPYQQGPQASQHPITQQGHPSIPPPPYAPLASSVSIPPSGMLSSSQSYLIPPPPPPPHSYSAAPQNSDWNQNQHISPPIPRIPPPPHLQGQQFYRVPVPPRIPLLPPPPTSSYFTPAPFGSFVQPANESSLGHLPPPPPPPPPSSPPPGPPPLPPSSPPPNSPFRSSSKSFTTAPELGPTSRKPSIVDMVASGHDNSIKCTSPNDSATNVKGTSDFNIMLDIPLPPPRPRDEKIVRKIEVLCQYIAKNGHKFEDMTRQKEVDNPEFEFLFGGAPGSEAAISHEYFKWMKKNCSSNELLVGGHNRNISSEPDGSQAGISHSPDVSDMDMEDDITQLEEPDIGKSFGSAKSEPTFISNKVDITVEEHDEHMTHKDATDENLSCPGSSGVIEQGVNLSQDDMQFEKSSMKVGVSNSEWSLDSKAEQQKISLYREMNQSAASDTAEVPAEPIRGTSPFKLIQGYASDDSEPHLEDLSPAPVSPQIKESTTDLDGLHTDIESMPFVEGSLNTASKFPEPSTRTEVVEQAFVDGGTSITDFKQNDRLVDDNVGSKNGGNQKEERKGKMEVDEFGRMVKAGGSDSDSDNYTRRRGKRGRSRSRSRSRSPVGRRRRSPWRRRENRSRSRSWSPKKRSRSRSPYRYGGGAGGDWSRRNKSHLPVCFDFRRGKCFRGESCRYLHDSEKNEESRRHKNKQQYQEVPDRLKTSSKLVSEKDEIDNQEMLIYSDVDKDSQRVKEEFLEPVSPHETLDVDKGLENCSDPLLQNSNDQLPIGAHPLNQTPPVEPQLPLPPLSQGTQLPREYNVMPTSNYSLPPPPPRPQLGGPLPQYQQTQMPPHMNYPFQAFVRPYPFPPEMLTHSVVGESHLGIYPPAALESQRPLSQTEDFRPRTFPMNYPIPQQPGGPMIFGEENFPRVPSPNLISSNSNSQTAVHPPSEGHAYMSRYGLPNPNPIADSISTLVDPGKINPRYPTDFPDGGQLSSMSEFGRSRISTHYNPYASTFDQPLSTKFSSGAFSQPTSIHYLARRSEGDQYDPIFDSIEPSLNSIKKSDKIEGSTKLLDMEENSKHKEVVMTTSTSVENDEFGETADAEVGAVENDSPSSFPIDLTDVATGEIEIDQVKSSGKTKKGKDSRSMKLFKVALADFVKEVLKPSWRQGNMSKEAFKTIVKKTVDKVSGAMKKHQLPKSQAKINQYIDSSQRKLTKLVMGYVDKYVKV